MSSKNSIYKTSESSKLILDRYKEILNQYPVKYETHAINTREGETFVIESGTKGAPKLILLHGSMSNALMWMKEVAAWDRDFHIFSVDIIGEPGLSDTSRPALDSPAYAEWLDDIRAQLEIDSYSLVGTSLGGWFALDYTIRRPDSIEKLVLISPGGVGRQKSIMYWVIPLSLMGDWGKNKVRELMVGKLATNTSSLSSDLLSFMAMIPRHFNPRLETLPIFSDDDLSNISIPVFAVVGGKDMMLDASQIRLRLESNIEKLTLDYLPEARHFPGDRSAEIHRFLLE